MLISGAEFESPHPEADRSMLLPIKRDRKPKENDECKQAGGAWITFIVGDDLFEK